MQRPEVKAFKNTLRNYRYYIDAIADVNKNIEMCYHRLGGVRSTDLTKVLTKSPPNKELEYRIRDDIERLEAMRSRLQGKVDEMDEILGKIEKTTRDALICVYVNGEQMRAVADRLYISHSTLQRRMDSAICRSLSE